MQNFNLIDHPWIPVRWKSTTADNPPLVSLHDAFVRGEEIADLDCLPQERISIIRLLVCITHATIGAPATPDGWNSFGDNLAQEATDYLERDDIHPHFDLLGDGPRFLQEDVPEKGEPVPTSKLISSLATGNNPTLLDHHGMSSSRDYDPATIARALLTFQNFYPLYGAGYKGKGPCCESNAIHSILIGKQLQETILLNCIDLQTISTTGCKTLGNPSWEAQTKAESITSTTTILGRLSPRHRSLKLTSDLSGFYHRKESLQYPGWEPFREASVTTFIDQKDNRRILPARVSRGIWRDLHIITLLNQNHDGTSPVLQSHEQEFDDEQCTIWSGALVTDLKAKILNTVESTFTLPLREALNKLVFSEGVEERGDIPA
ncbi:MAG: type I-E CRISPR-associated protein Cse1/CasA [Verrucomicrobiota bacterium]